MRNRYQFILMSAAVLAVALTACGGDTGVTGDIQVHIEDSAGVRIVEYAGMPETEPPFSFAQEPVYRYGAGGGDYMFSFIANGKLLTDGSAAIFDVGNGEVVLLDPGGTSGSVLASSGEGPGEVGSVTAMFAPGQDSLLLEDKSNTRFALFVGGSLAHATAIPAAVGYAFSAHGIAADGQILMSSAGYSGGFPEDWLRGYMVRLDLGTGAADTVATYDYVSFVPPDNAPRHPFPHFGLVSAVHGEFVYARTDTPELTWRHSDGSVRQIVRWEPEWVYPTDEHWELFANDIRETAHTYNPQAQTDEARAALVESMLGRYQLNPDTPLPLFTTPLGDDEGRVWLGKFTVAHSLARAVPSYTVFSPDGEWLGRVTVPDGLRVVDVAAGRVLGVMKGEMDVESVVVYELVER